MICEVYQSPLTSAGKVQHGQQRCLLRFSERKTVIPTIITIEVFHDGLAPVLLSPNQSLSLPTRQNHTQVTQIPTYFLSLGLQVQIQVRLNQISWSSNVVHTPEVHSLSCQVC